MPFSMPMNKLVCNCICEDKKRVEKQLLTETDPDLITELNLKLSIINRLLGN